jgi:hypothetical protein
VFVNLNSFSVIFDFTVKTFWVFLEGNIETFGGTEKRRVSEEEEEGDRVKTAPTYAARQGLIGDKMDKPTTSFFCNKGLTSSFEDLDFDPLKSSSSEKSPSQGLGASSSSSSFFFLTMGLAFAKWCLNPPPEME